jgi:hypothetical protein
MAATESWLGWIWPPLSSIAKHLQAAMGHVASGHGS